MLARQKTVKKRASHAVLPWRVHWSADGGVLALQALITRLNSDAEWRFSKSSRCALHGHKGSEPLPTSLQSNTRIQQQPLDPVLELKPNPKPFNRRMNSCAISYKLLQGSEGRVPPGRCGDELVVPSLLCSLFPRGTSCACSK